MRFAHKFYGWNACAHVHNETTVGANVKLKHGCKLIYVKKFHFDKSASACALAQSFFSSLLLLFFRFHFFCSPLEIYNSQCSMHNYADVFFFSSFIEWYSNQTTQTNELPTEKEHECQTICISYYHTCVICMRVSITTSFVCTTIEKLVSNQQETENRNEERTNKISNGRRKSQRQQLNTSYNEIFRCAQLERVSIRFIFIQCVLFNLLIFFCCIKVY